MGSNVCVIKLADSRGHVVLKKLIVVYNPRASHHGLIEEEVLRPLRGVRGWIVGKYHIKPTSFDDNADSLARLLSDGDSVLVAGGDGTATMAVNGVLRSGKQVMVGVLGYGNFNDISRTLGTEKVSGVGEVIKKLDVGEVEELYPLEVKVNGKHWRYAPCYYTMGLLAQATELMDEKRMRKKLESGRCGPLFSLTNAVKWYLKHHKKQELPSGRLNGVAWGRKTTDYLAVNGVTMARLMKIEHGGWWQEKRTFGSSLQRLGNFWRMVRFGLKSVWGKVPLANTEGDVIEFDEPSTVEMHVEGEFERMENVEKIEVAKTGRALKVVAKCKL